MDISVTEFKQTCLEVIRAVERSGHAVAITRRGKVVARLSPVSATQRNAGLPPWERMRALGGRLLAGPSESLLRAADFEASR